MKREPREVVSSDLTHYDTCSARLRGLFDAFDQEIAEALPQVHPYLRDNADYYLQDKHVFCRVLLQPRRGCMQLRLHVNKHDLPGAKTVQVTSKPHSSRPDPEVQLRP